MFSIIARKQNVLLLLIVTCSGCAGVDYCHRAPTELKILGTVRTGGPLAKATTLPIHLQGLTLSDVVESTIRPGLLSTGAIDFSTTVPPVDLQTTILQEKIDNLMSDSAEYEDADDFIRQLRQLEGVSPLTAEGFQENEIKKQVQDALDSGALKKKIPHTDSEIVAGEILEENETQKTEREALKSLLLMVLGVTDELNRVKDEREAIFRSEAGIPGASDLVAVRVSRRNGTRLIFPLPMIRNYSLGDLWMTDGDVVQMMPWGMTEAGQQLPGTISTPVSSLLVNVEDNKDAGLNLIILVHQSVLDGRPEEYYLPARNANYYGSTAFVRQWQDACFHHEGDALRAGSLELNSLIRKSQLNTVAASAAELEEQLNPKVDSFGAKCKRKVTQCSKTVEQVPVVGGVFSQVNDRIGPMLQRDPLQESTGFDREEFCKSLTP